ncbi:conserved hypothetical protein [Verticillium alfalfae VaMs.102]|uniref:Uncharacterized protein n=1 Tax=Verticillium alfalfae (strain VaMs.102 / ATCC MYA-4576 / FGSC 10136) TaxID=526221 RepID=C9SMV0_VERA1|nr:conserved hypothetical protein [Verticillium alfalfae VaMs.102]EEY20115.1 conserved hypothetical protein [Verticillium alfalfae VaMs.102]
MASRDAFISNGTCYLAPGQEAIDSMIPCGNDAFGRVSCCQQGDMCLTSNACYNQQFGVTYLAGCSDPTYDHRSCPDKGAFDGTPWVGLTYCNGTSEQWVACEQSGRQDALTEADQCWCPQTDRTVAFTASSVSTETPEPTDNGLSTPARIGIGVGVGVGSAVLLALLALFFFTRRRRQRHEAQANASAKGDRPDSLMPPSEAPQTPTTAVSEIDSRAATPWALRTELDGKSLAAEMDVPPVPPVPSQLGEKKEKKSDEPVFELPA